MRDDLGVAEALLGVAVRAVLAQPDPVAPSVPGDDERCGTGRHGFVHAGSRRRSTEQQANGDEYERSTHDADPSEDAHEASKGPHVQHLFFTEP